MQRRRIIAAIHPPQLFYYICSIAVRTTGKQVSRQLARQSTVLSLGSRQGLRDIAGDKALSRASSHWALGIIALGIGHHRIGHGVNYQLFSSNLTPKPKTLTPNPQPLTP
ncbi:MAG: hypothetical protein KME26_07435 [Oscillatoria princeps RMCB-10]|nr:hypothetical protein [Oscillatoria princeps RMCB-10]